MRRSVVALLVKRVRARRWSLIPPRIFQVLSGCYQIVLIQRLGATVETDPCVTSRPCQSGAAATRTFGREFISFNQGTHYPVPSGFMRGKYPYAPCRELMLVHADTN